MRFKSVFGIALAAVMLLLQSVGMAQLVTLKNSTESITVLLSGAPATTQPNYNLTWMGPANQGLTSATGVFTGVTPVTALAGPDSGSTRSLHNLTIYNADTASVTATINKKVGSTSYPLVKQAIASGATLTWNEKAGVTISSTTAPANVGTVAGTGVSVSEQGNGVIQKSVFTFSGATITMRDTEQGGGLKIYDFPEGRISILGVTGTGIFTTTSAIASTLNSGVTCQWSLGTVTQTNTTLATTEQDLIPVTAWTSGTTINVANTATKAALAAAAQFDGTTTAKDAYLNLAVAGATDIDANATVSPDGSVIVVTWVFLGDY